MRTTQRVLPFVRRVLQEIADFEEAFYGGPPGYTSAYRKGGPGYAAELQHLHEDRATRRALTHLKRKKCIKDRKTSDALLASLTSDGWMVAIRDRIRLCRRVKEHDSRVFVIFDIPERTRGARDGFRRLLKEWGFRYLQQSIWESNRDVGKDVARYAMLCGAERWIRVIEGRLQETNRNW